MTSVHCPPMREVERRRWACARIHGDHAAVADVAQELDVSPEQAQQLADAELQDRRQAGREDR